MLPLVPNVKLMPGVSLDIGDFITVTAVHRGRYPFGIVSSATPPAGLEYVNLASMFAKTNGPTLYNFAVALLLYGNLKPTLATCRFPKISVQDWLVSVAKSIFCEIVLTRPKKCI